jgi:hypothetical protein
MLRTLLAHGTGRPDDLAASNASSTGTSNSVLEPQHHLARPDLGACDLAERPSTLRTYSPSGNDVMTNPSLIGLRRLARSPLDVSNDRMPAEPPNQTGRLPYRERWR